MQAIRGHSRNSVVAVPSKVNLDSEPAVVMHTGSTDLTGSLRHRSPAANDPLLRRPSLAPSLEKAIDRFVRHPDGAAFDEGLSALHNNVIAGDNRRGIRDMMIKAGVGNPLTATYQFGKAQSVGIVVGFKVPVPNEAGGYDGIQETDGPLGAAFLALGCLETKKPVSIICDSETQHLVEACLRELQGEDAVRAVRFLPYEAQGAKAQNAANGIAAKLAEARMDTLISIEVAGQNAEGRALSMRGIDITEMNPDYDTLIRTLKTRPDVAVIAIGDGGNEAGFGGSVTGVPTAANGKQMQAATGADHAVPATVSNWGGYFLYAGLMRLAGKHSENMPTPERHAHAIQAMLRKNAVDGCTLSSAPNVVDMKGQRTGVDGMSIEKNTELYRQVREWALTTGKAEFTLGKLPGWDEPVTVFMYDSSDGGLYAAKVAIPYIDAQLPGEKTYVILTDHANAPYGSKSPRELESYVYDCLDLLGQYSDAPVIMACNTACIGIERLVNNGVEVNAINLVRNTSEVVASDPYLHVGLLATPAMADSKLYPRFISESSERLKAPQKDVQVRGCPGWADMVNQGWHNSTDPEVQFKVDEAIANIVTTLPPDLDAIYLCCTHYPALATKISAAYEAVRVAKGIRKPFTVIDPMKRQAETAVSAYANGGFHQAPLDTTVPIVILTSGDPKQVRETARGILGRNDFVTRQFRAGEPSPVQAWQQPATIGAEPARARL